MERNHIIESICTVCHCAARRAEEYLDNELIRLRALCATAIWKRPAPIWDWSTTMRNTFLRRLPDS